MEIRVTVDGDSGRDPLVALRTTLAGEPTLRGRTELVSRPPDEGALGSEFVAIAVELAPMAIAAFTTMVVTWIRHRSGRFTVRVTGPNGAVWEVTGEKLSGLDAEAVQQVVTELTAALTREAQQATSRELP